MSEWPCLYKLIGIGVEQLPDGRYVGVNALGFRSAPCLSIEDAFQAATNHIDTYLMASVAISR